jgi:hypothetical protein
MSEASEKLAALETRREERKERLREQEAEQVLLDLEAIDALELEVGDSNVSVVNVPFSPGMPARAAVRTPTSAELKRYKDRIRPRGAEHRAGDSIGAAEELGRACVKYPAGNDLAELLEARPGLPMQLGLAALALSKGQSEAEGKG